MALIDKVDKLLDNHEDWVSAKEVSDRFECPLSSATSALATIYKLDGGVSRILKPINGVKRKRRVYFYKRHE